VESNPKNAPIILETLAHRILKLIATADWQTVKENVIPGTMVLVKDDHAPPLLWRLGRVIEVFPGPDGRVRSVSVRTVSGTYTRPITKVCALPII
jgi:hypothetical protein